MESQLIIKIVLIAAFALLAVVLVLPMRGARNQAIRSLAVVAFLVFTVLAITFPETVNTLANIVGVGRGTDLILYILAVFVIAHVIASSRKNRGLERQITQIVRKMAIDSAATPSPK